MKLLVLYLKVRWYERHQSIFVWEMSYISIVLVSKQRFEQKLSRDILLCPRCSFSDRRCVLNKSVQFCGVTI